MAWYEDWFNSKEYLTVYRHRNEAEAKQLVDLILKNVQIPAGSDVLDMACGAGRHAILFAKKGFDVTAVDLSQALLSIAKERAERFNLNIQFVNSDLRKFSINKKFALVNNLFTSFGYFEEDEENFKILKIAFEHLKNGGYFVIDYLNRYEVEKNLVPRSITELPDGSILQERRINSNRVEKKITINNNGSEKSFTESVRMYSEDELKNAVKKTGFNIEKVFGDFEGNNFNLQTSPRIIIIARK